MAEFASILIDPKRAADGKWVRWLDGVELKIASSREKAYQDERKQLLKPHIRAIRDDKLDGDDLIVVLAPAIAKHLLKDWKGLEEGGAPLPYSLDKARDLLAHPNAPHLREFVLRAAGDDEQFIATREDSLGN